MFSSNKEKYSRDAVNGLMICDITIIESTKPNILYEEIAWPKSINSRIYSLFHKCITL